MTAEKNRELENGTVARLSSDALPKKVMACILMGIMVLASFAMLGAVSDVAPADTSVPAEIEAVGPRSVSYTVSNIFESNLKVSDNTSLGKHTGAPGVNQWWYQRQAGGTYGDWVVRGTYPFVISYPPYGYAAVTGAAPQMPWGTYSFYKIAIDAQNIQTMQTGANEDPIMIPILGQKSASGGNVQVSWHITYMTNEECLLLDAGTSYANAYYGVPLKGGGNGAPQGFGGYYANDGWYFEISGKMTFDRAAAGKFLGLTGAGDLRTQFDTANAGWALSSAWRADWWAEGSLGGAYDPFACYQYSIDALTVYLTKDPTSTADNLVVRIFSDSWGMDGILDRWLDVAGVTSKINYFWPEDLYLNATFGVDDTDLTMVGVNTYHLYSWKDPQAFSAAWMFESMHSDYMNDTRTGRMWESHFIPYNPVRYSPKTGYFPSKMNWMPGTSTYGKQTSYWYTPTAWSLAENEQIVIKLGNAKAWGVAPYGDFDGDDALGAAKAAELISHGVWGELVLGHTVPSSLYSLTYYNPATKTLTLNGPMTMPRNVNSLFPLLNETGTPLVPLVVSPVSHYDMQIVESGPYYVGSTYTLKVTAKNFTAATVTNWNGTVGMVGSAGVSVAASHTYVPGDAGVWTTSISASSAGTKTIDATDSNYPLDIADSLMVSFVTQGPAYGLLRVTTNPAVSGMIYCNGNWMSQWGINWVKMAPGQYTLSFGDVPGFVTPADAVITIADGQTTTYQADYVATGSLRVMTNPALPGTIYVNGAPRNDWGFWTDVPAGTYTVSFGAVANYATPSPQTVTVASGAYVPVTGNYVWSEGAPGPDPQTYGMLRATTNPAVPSTIYVDHMWMGQYGLEWVKLQLGEHEISFSDVPGFETPSQASFTISAGATTTFEGVFVRSANLRVTTDPAVPSTIYVNGNPRNDWGLWTDIPPGSYTVSWGAVPGWVAPAPQTVTLGPGENAWLVGTFTPAR